MGRILSRGVSGELFGGCYFAATGSGTGTGTRSERERAFLRPVFARLLEEQDYVSWSAEAVAEEAWYGRLTRWGYASLAAVVAAEAAYLAWLFLA